MVVVCMLGTKGRIAANRERDLIYYFLLQNILKKLCSESSVDFWCQDLLFFSIFSLYESTVLHGSTAVSQ